MNNKKSTCKRSFDETEFFKNLNFSNNSTQEKSFVLDDFGYYSIWELSKYSKIEQRDIISFLFRFISQLKSAIESYRKYAKK